MNLQQHCDVIGFGQGKDSSATAASDLAYHAGIHLAVAQRALDGKPITQANALKIRRYMATRFGYLQPDSKEYAVDGLQTV